MAETVCSHRPPAAVTPRVSAKKVQPANDPATVNIKPDLAQLPVTPPSLSIPCDQTNRFYPDDPAGHWTDGDPNIINRCDCIAKGIRIVGEHFGTLSGSPMPVIFLQVFNRSGEPRTIWANVKFLSSGWETTPPFTLRADERQGRQTIKALEGNNRITDVNVLGCS